MREQEGKRTTLDKHLCGTTGFYRVVVYYVNLS